MHTAYSEAFKSGYDFGYPILTPRPDGPLGFRPPNGGGEPKPLTLLPDVVARYRKNAFESSTKIITKYSGQFFAKVNIVVT